MTLTPMRTVSPPTGRRRVATLEASPRRALLDAPVAVTARGLVPGQRVTLAAAVKDDGPLFASHAHYTADAQGCVDLSKHPATAGTYHGEDIASEIS